MISVNYRPRKTTGHQLSNTKRRVIQIPEGMESMVLGNPILADFLVEKDQAKETSPELLVQCLNIIIQIQGAAESWAGFVMRNEFSERDAQQKIHDVIYDNEFQSEAIFSILNQYAQDTFGKTLKEKRKYQLNRAKAANLSTL
jgi:hypothetical protein